jgi:hypothetical protein
MKRSRSQAIYKFLPGGWVDYKDKDDQRTRDRAYSILLDNWNTEPMRGLYSSRIMDEISRQIEAFESRGGDVRSFLNHRDTRYFSFVEASRNEGIGQIRGKMDPLVFYCNNCKRVQEFTGKKGFVPPAMCDSCRKGVMRQLQLVYSCECGYASGVKVPYRPKGVKNIYYEPIEHRFKFVYYQDKNKHTIEMIMKCNCGANLFPRNATDPSHFIPAMINTVNLIDEDEGHFFDYGDDAKRIVLGRWLGEVSDELYGKILKNPVRYESHAEEDEEEYKKFLEFSINVLKLSPEEAEKAARNGAEGMKRDRITLKSLATKSTGSLANIDDSLQYLASEFIEFQTLKYAKKRIVLDDAITQALRVEKIADGAEVRELNKRLGISNAQLSYNVELITSAYGFMRKKNDPTMITDGKQLKLNSFGRGREGMKVYCSKLETEGILIELDRDRIIQWLMDNGVDGVDEPDGRDPAAVKRWFLENIDLNAINPFSAIDRGDENVRTRITRHVYALLHSISHTLIRSAGTLSGLDKNSLSELLFPNVPAIFIYAQTSQGLPIGALSGMFEQDYKVFLESAFLDSQTCVFDPICSTKEEGASCSGCIYLAEVSCTHFNHDLDRHLLHGNTGDEADIKKGFWS